MKIKEKKGVTHYYDYEIDNAINKYECGIQFDVFFNTQAEKFEYGKKAYYNMLKHELEDFDEREWGCSDETLYYYIYSVKDNIEKIRKIIYQFADQPATDTNTNTTKKRVINEKEIRKLFNTELNLQQKGTTQTKGERLISSIKVDRTTKKEYARISKIMYESKKITTDKDFNKWLPKFYELIGIENGTNYKPSIIDITPSLKKEFDYL